MSDYQHILVAVDLSEATNTVLLRAKNLASSNTVISIIHVIEPIQLIYGADAMIDTGELQQNLQAHAKQHLTEALQENQVSAQHILTPVGRAADEVHSASQTIDADLIVLGSHGRHGLQLLLGSTANAVLHGAPVDVMAVRIRETI